MDKAHTHKVSCVMGFYAGSFLLSAFCISQGPSAWEVRGLLALSIHGVHCHGSLKVVAVMEGRVV